MFIRISFISLSISGASTGVTITLFLCSVLIEEVREVSSFFELFVLVSVTGLVSVVLVSGVVLVSVTGLLSVTGSVIVTGLLFVTGLVSVSAP